jgi:hypothetical protein
VTDFSSKGLLPQLTDVLEALTSSHELLLLKLQSVRFQHVRDDSAMISHLPARAQRFDSKGLGLSAPITPRPQTRGEDQPGLSADADQPVPSTDSMESSTGSHPHARPKSDPVSDIEPVDFAGQSTRAPASITALTRRDDDRSAFAESPTTIDPEQPSYLDESEANLANRNYNFFDELDDQLAGLDDKPGAGPVPD